MLRYLVLALLLGVSPVHGQDESAEQLALSVYLGESGRALIIGYAEESRLSDLPFLAQ